MNRDIQNSIIKNPIPILIGNTSLLSTNIHEYTYTSSYIVDNVPGTEYNVLFFDSIQNKWALHHHHDYSYKINYFPQLSSSVGTYSMNGFVNNECGYPEFYRDGYERTFHFNKFMNTWCYGYKCKSISGNIYAQRAIDTTDIHTGDFVESENISAFIQDKPELTGPLYKNYKLIEGDPTIPSSLLKFQNSDGQIISGKIVNNEYSFLRSDTSPNIISGEPCLGYYFSENNDIPYVIGSLCIGTEDLTTVPPIIGQNILLNRQNYFFDSKYGSNVPDVYPGCISGIWCEAAYLWVGTTFDKSKTEWNLYQIKSYKWGEIGPQYVHNTYILLSGGFPNIDPCTAEKLWYMQSNKTDLFNYSVLSGGLTFTAYPEGEDLELKIVGLTSFNADEVKHYGTEEESPTYIGNWISPQPTWRN